MAKIKKEKKEENIVENQVQNETAIIDDSPIAIPGTPITKNKLNEYKAQFKRIFLTEYAGEIFVWHRLNRRDFTNIYNETQDITDVEEQTTEREKRFCAAALLFPEDKELEDFLEDDLSISPICDEILYKSGFVLPQTQEL